MLEAEGRVGLKAPAIVLITFLSFLNEWLQTNASVYALVTHKCKNQGNNWNVSDAAPSRADWKVLPSTESVSLSLITTGHDH